MGDREREMLDLLAAIHQHDVRLGEIGQEIERVRGQLSSIRNRLVVEVSSATDERGRRMYANEQLRRAEVALRMDRDDEARGLRAKSSQLEGEYSQVAQQASHLRSRLEVLRLFTKSD